MKYFSALASCIAVERDVMLADGLCLLLLYDFVLQLLHLKASGQISEFALYNDENN